MRGVQRSKNHGVHDRENSRSRTDAEAQGENDDDRESRIPRQHTERVSKVTVYVLHPSRAAAVAIELTHGRRVKLAYGRVAVNMPNSVRRFPRWGAGVRVQAPTIGHGGLCDSSRNAR